MMNAYEEHEREEFNGQLTYFKYYIYTHWYLFFLQNKDITLYIRGNHDGQPICHKCHKIPHSPPKRFFSSKDAIFICIFVFIWVEILKLLFGVFLTIFAFTNMTLWEYEPTDPPYIHLLRLKWLTYHVQYHPKEICLITYLIL